MKTLNASHLFPDGAASSRFESARALALSLAETDGGLLEPELMAWIDYHSRNASPVLEGCGGPDAWHDYGVTHGGRLEVNIQGEAGFIFAESSPYDSYEHFSPSPFRNIRDAQGIESIYWAGSRDGVALDEWTSQLT
jgi:hypothetical protein